MAGDRAGRKERVTSYAKLTYMDTFDFQPLNLAYMYMANWCTVV